MAASRETYLAYRTGKPSKQQSSHKATTHAATLLVPIAIAIEPGTKQIRLGFARIVAQSDRELLAILDGAIKNRPFLLVRCTLNALVISHGT